MEVVGGDQMSWAVMAARCSVDQLRQDWSGQRRPPVEGVMPVLGDVTFVGAHTASARDQREGATWRE